MDGKDLQRRVGPAAAGKGTRASLEALRQHQRPGAAGTAEDILRVSRHQAAERDSSAASLDAASRRGMPR